MVYIRKSHLNEWFGVTPILGNLHCLIKRYICLLTRYRCVWCVVQGYCDCYQCLFSIAMYCYVLVWLSITFACISTKIVSTTAYFVRVMMLGSSTNPSCIRSIYTTKEPTYRVLAVWYHFDGGQSYQCSHIAFH
jgi:hypothetical protein